MRSDGSIWEKCDAHEFFFRARLRRKQKDLHKLHNASENPHPQGKKRITKPAQWDNFGKKCQSE